MYITSRARGKRLGKALMDHCLNFARDNKYTICYLESLPEFRDALKLYTQSGFEYIPDRMGDTGYYGCTLFLTKNLKAH